MSELGVLTGTGILIFLICVLFLLPALLLATGKGTGNGAAAGRLELRSFGSDRLVRLAIARPRATVLAWVVIVAVCAALAPNLQFSDNIENLRAKGNEGVLNQTLVTRKFGQSFGFMMYVVQAGISTASCGRPRTRPGADRGDRARPARLPAIDLDLPAAAVAADGGPGAPAAGRDGAFSIGRIAATLHRALAANGFRPDAYDPFLRLFGQALSRRGRWDRRTSMTSAWPPCCGASSRRRTTATSR